ncbi:MAG TPA: proton-conducting transporter membrane subunit [Ktedonobacterales bacterium]|jgi:hydrogenase-4 component B
MMDLWPQVMAALETTNLTTLSFWLALGLCGLGALLAFVLPGRKLGYTVAALAATLAGVACMICAIGVLVGETGPSADWLSPFPFGPLLIRLDALGAVFLLVIGMVVIPVALFSIGYYAADARSRPTQQAQPEGEDGDSARAWHARSLRAYGVLFCLLLASLVLIVSAGDGILFIIAWESMAFLSYLAAIYHYEDRKVTRRVYLMLAVSEGATAGVIIAFLFLYQASGSFAFADMRLAGPHLDIGLRSLLFILVLIGFGAKAGMLPFQLWVVEAYPAAPAPMSALLSGVISELAIYGLMRFTLDLLGTGPGWWGGVMMTIGIITALIGVLYSLVQDNLKRLIAYSSVEHVGGIMLVGLGATLSFQSAGMLPLAAIAGLATLYHVLNHAVFKGLLFLGAGAVDRAAGSVHIERLGGLARRLPLVAGCFLVGALAISAVPPFNGFVSEWLLLESLLQSFAVATVGMKLLMTGAGATLALVAGIAVTATVRAFGVPFLGQARSPQAEHADASTITPMMRFSLFWLAFLCLALGVIPVLVLSGLNQATTALLGVNVYDLVVPPLYTGHPGAYAPLVGLGGGLLQGIIPGNGLVIIASPTFSTIDSPTLLLVAEVLLLVILWIARRAVRPLGTRRVGPVWAGGILRFEPRMSYSGVAYSNPIRIMFNALLRSRATVEPIEPAARHGRGHIVYRQEIPEPFDRVLYRPLARVVAALAQRVKVIQSGNINQYIAYIFGIVLLILLLRAL